MAGDPTKLDWTAMRCLDRHEAKLIKEYTHYQHMTPAQRIGCVEHLRQMWHGADALNAKIKPAIRLIERA